MKKLLIISVLLLQNTLFQTSAVTGKWTFTKFESEEKLDDESKLMLNQMMASFSWDFKEDGSYIFQKKRKQETGKWKADKDFITTENSTGFSEKIKFIQNHNDTLKLEIEKGQYAVFKREK